MLNIVKEYVIWNEFYRVVLIKDEKIINFYWISWLYQKFYNFLLIIGFLKEGSIILYYFLFGNIKSFDSIKVFYVFKKVISIVYFFNSINLIFVERGFFKINDKVFVFVCLFVLDDKDLIKFVVGVFFLVRDIDEFVFLIQFYMVDRIYFVDKINVFIEENFFKNYVELFDIDGYRIGIFVINYNERIFVNIKRYFEKLFIIIFLFFIVLILFIVFLGGVYFIRRVI